MLIVRAIGYSDISIHRRRKKQSDIAQQTDVEAHRGVPPYTRSERLTGGDKWLKSTDDISIDLGDVVNHFRKVLETKLAGLAQRSKTQLCPP